MVNRPKAVCRNRTVPNSPCRHAALIGVLSCLALSCSDSSNSDAMTTSNNTGTNNNSGTDNNTGDNGGMSNNVTLSDLDYAPCDIADRVGGFKVILDEEFTGIEGRVNDGVVPSNVPEVVSTQGDCSLLRGRNLFCEPACGSQETCDDDGGCIPYPQGRNVGDVAVTGLKAELSMSPSASSKSYTNPPMFPHPGYDEGDIFTLTAAGGDYEAFTLTTWGVAMFEPGSSEVPVEADSPIDLEWTPPTSDGPAKVHVEVNINNHGVTSAWIACDVADTGSASVPASLVTQLVDLGFSGYPTVLVRRQSAASTDIEPGCVDFLASSEVTLDATVPGLVSCSQNEDCPPDQNCQDDLTCQ